MKTLLFLLLPFSLFAQDLLKVRGLDEMSVTLTRVTDDYLWYAKEDGEQKVGLPSIEYFYSERAEILQKMDHCKQCRKKFRNPHLDPRLQDSIRSVMDPGRPVEIADWEVHHLKQIKGGFIAMGTGGAVFGLTYLITNLRAKSISQWDVSTLEKIEKQADAFRANNTMAAIGSALGFGCFIGGAIVGSSGASGLITYKKRSTASIGPGTIRLAYRF